MPIPHYLRELFQHMQWADSVVWRTVLASEAARGEQRVFQLLIHIHQVQHAFLSVWKDEEPRWVELDTFASLEAMLPWAREVHEQLPSYLESVDDLEQIKEVAWRRWVERNIGRPPAPTTLGEMMLQVSQHSTYHRGQVNARLRDIGVDPPLTDFIAWVWLAKPAPEWPQT